jgi:CBS-domain-containing membrane protein
MVGMKIEQLMSRPVQSCQRGDTINRAAQIMWEADVGCVPVVDADNRVVGIVTDRDVAMAAYTQGRLLEHMAVEHVMANEVLTCKAEESIGTVEERMRKHQVRRLPVVDGAGHLIGIVSLNDIAIEAAQEKGVRKREVPLDGVAKTLAAICQHRHEALAIAAQ